MWRPLEEWLMRDLPSSGWGEKALGLRWWRLCRLEEEEERIVECMGLEILSGRWRWRGLR